MKEEKKLRITYFCPFIGDEPNTTTYQRPKYLSMKNTLFFFTGRETIVPEEIRRNATIVRGPLDFSHARALTDFGVYIKF